MMAFVFPLFLVRRLLTSLEVDLHFLARGLGEVQSSTFWIFFRLQVFYFHLGFTGRFFSRHLRVSFLLLGSLVGGLELLVDFESTLRVSFRLQVSNFDLGFTGRFFGSRHFYAPFCVV